MGSCSLGLAISLSYLIYKRFELITIYFYLFFVFFIVFIAIFRSKMALQMAATVLCSSVFVLFLFVFPVLCFSKTSSFTRDELLNIRQNTHKIFYRILIIRMFCGHCSSWRSRSSGLTLQDTQTGGSEPACSWSFRQSGFRTPLPSIHLANLRSLPNKTSTLPDRQGFSNSAALCFTENLAEWRHTGQRATSS